MYNRYVPQGDGSFQRSAIPDPPRREPPKEPPRPVPPPNPQPPLPKEPQQPPSPPEPCPPPEEKYREPQRATDFFSRLLPQNMDSGDLLMLLILLLLLNDGSGDAPPALLTLALYFLLKPEEGCGT